MHWHVYRLLGWLIECKHIPNYADANLILSGLGPPWNVVPWSPTQCFLSRASGEIVFQGLSYGGILRLVYSSQGFGLRDSQREAPQLLCNILPRSKKMCTSSLELTLFEAQRGPPQDLVKNVPNDANFKVILTSFETLVKHSVFVPLSNALCSELQAK